MTSVWLDTREALRGLRRSTGFAVISIASLALGIGAIVTVFTLLNALLLRNLPVRDPETLVDVSTVLSSRSSPVPLTFPAFRELDRRQQAFSSLIGWWGGAVLNVQVGNALVRGNVWAVTGNFHSELGVAPVHGRLLLPSDIDWSSLEPARVAVLGFGFWQRVTGGDPRIVGHTVQVDDIPFTIVGVAPPGFGGLYLTTEPEVTIPLTAEPFVTRGTLDRIRAGRSNWVSVTGRLKPGITLDGARAHLQTIWPEINAAAVPADFSGGQREEFLAASPHVVSGARGNESFLRTRFTGPLYAIGGVALLVLLIASVNLASLLFARTAQRARELHVRMAMGASKWRVARLQIMEGLLLGLVGAVFGLVFAWWASGIVTGVIFERFIVPATLSVAPDGRVIAFTMIVALVAVGMFTCVPCLWITRRNTAQTMRYSTRTIHGIGLTGKALIVSQVALCFVMVTMSTMLVRTLYELRAVPVGFRSERVVSLHLFPVPGGYRDLEHDSYYSSLLNRISSLPAVTSAAVAYGDPGSGGLIARTVRPATSSRQEGGPTATFLPVTHGFFATLDIPIEAGRDFSERDGSSAPRVAVLSRSLAERLFPGGDAIGRAVAVGNDPNAQHIEVVGVAADAMLREVRDKNPFAVYVPFTQEKELATYGRLLVRADAEPATILATVREAVKSLGREQVMAAAPLSQARERSFQQERLTAIAAAFFGLCALLLSAVGLYGLMAFDVARRTSEIGLRMALGCLAAQIVRMISGESLRIVAIGIGFGVPLAIGATMLVRHLLFGVQPGDPLMMFAAGALLLLVGLFAGLQPARRAASIAPLNALRAE